MQAITHTIEHSYQSTNNNCGQTALTMLFSNFGLNISAEEIMQAVPVNNDENGNPMGTINQNLAGWALGQGFKVTMYTFDFQIIDLSWQKYSQDKVVERLEAAKHTRDIPALGQYWSKQYVQSYINFVKAGGELHIKPCVTRGLLNELLQKSPVLACVSYSVLYNKGRSKKVGLRKSVDDDINGTVGTHTIVIYGITERGDFLIADPWEEPGLHTTNPERLVCAMTASQIECDNLIISLGK